MIRISILLPLICLLGTLSSEQTCAQSSVELSLRIDELIEQSAVGPLATVCNDADFLRRVTLDLTGVIPSAEHSQGFLADAAHDKRAREIDRLLESPEFNRFMTLQLSVLLLERRTEKNIPQRNWERFLYESLEADKPLDQLISELIYTDPAGAQHPANKFIFSREVEPNAITRDVGRLAFGMDLQCAQCHNHPLIETYYQEDYYGLYAFLHRTSTFTQPTTKQVRLAEKPDGEASFRSVFTGTARDHTTPRLPKERSLLEEPILLADDAYIEKPGKDSGGVPTFSRRQALAKMLRGSRQFQRNMANRIWALMFARGLVHPLDFHHRDNPPSHPILLDELADALVASEFKIRPMLSAIARSRTYQRSCEPPDAYAINFADIAARCELLTTKLATLKASTDALKNTSTLADSAYNELLAKHDAHALEMGKIVKEASDARSNLKKAEEEFQKVDAPFQKTRAQCDALKAALEKLVAAEKLIAGDRQLVDMSSKLTGRISKLDEALPGLEKASKEKQTLREKMQVAMSEKQSALATLQATRVPVDQLDSLEKTQIDANRRLADHLSSIHMIEQQIECGKLLADYQVVKSSDPGKAASLWQAIVESWTIHGQVAPLKPLSPEQLTLSSMHGAGVMKKIAADAAAQAKAIQAKAEAKAQALQAKASEKSGEAKGASTAPTEKVTDEGEAAGERSASLSSLEQQKLIDVVRARLDQFATLYGGLPGEDFQATVNQALFFGNGNVVDEWLKPGQGNLTDELVKLDPSEIANRMFLNILSRLPGEIEKRDVEQSLSAAGNDRPEAIKRWLWALLASSEFRFNH